MKTLFRALCALMLLASPAGATGYFVDGVSGDDGQDGSYAAPFATIGKANRTVVAGDSVYILAKTTTYADFPEPGADGTAGSRITYLGDSAAYNKIIVPSGTMQRDYVTRIGMRFTGGVDDPYHNGATGAIIAKCKIWQGSLVLHGNSIQIRSVIVGSDSGSAAFQVNPLLSTVAASDLNVMDCTFNLRPTSASNANSIFRLQPEWGGRIERMRFYRNTVNMETPDGQDPNIKWAMFNRLKNSHIVGCTFSLRDSSGGAAGGQIPQGILVRDGIDSLFVFNTTFTATTERAGLGPVAMHLLSSGNNLAGTGPNTFRWCTFKNYTPSVRAVQYQWKMQPGDSLTHCAIICSTAVSTSGFTILGSEGNTAIWRNNFINLGSGGALRLEPGGPWSGQMTIRNNNFYTRSTSTAAEFFAADYSPPVAGAGVVVSDYNNFAHFATNRAVKYFGSYSATGAAGLPCGGRNWDCNSIQKTPAFTDSVGDNWNLVPLGTIAAQTTFTQGAGWQGASIGQHDTTSATADVTAPAALTDLYALSTGKTAGLIVWTSPGDDASTGTATLYDVRISTSAITAGNFASATAVLGAPSPAVAGTVQTFILIGLTDLTTYYVAIKAVDEAGNAAAISNLPNFRTGVDRGDAVGD